MTLEPQKAKITTEDAASEETQNETAKQEQRTQSETQAEIEESAESNTKSEKTAQEQREAQPEAENEPQGLNETQAPAQPGAEDAVRERRIADEFALRWSAEALECVADRSSDYVREVAERAYARIHFAEAVLCGAILLIPIGRVGAIETFDKWWTPFKVGDQWFVLRYHDTYIREYELFPCKAPTPGHDGDEPTRNRQQRRAPPPRIGPRPRRRNGNDANGARAAAVRNPPRKTAKTKKGKKRKQDDAKRIVNELYDLASRELELRVGELNHSCKQLGQEWREILTHLLSSFDDMKRVGGIAFREAVASLVQLRQIALLARPLNSSFTSTRERASETFGPSGRLEASYVGHIRGLRLRLNSWRWDEPPVPWTEYLFGVDWTLDPFGPPEEEQAFT